MGSRRGSHVRVVTLFLAGFGLLAILFAVILGSTVVADPSETAERLAMSPVAYVAETDYDMAAALTGQSVSVGAAAFIDCSTDTVTSRPTVGTAPQDVAVSPDGKRVYMTDADEPVVHVFDADTAQKLETIALPGVKDNDRAAWMMQAFVSGAAAYSGGRPCTDAVACTPDGKLLLVTSNTGLQVVDVETGQVVRTLSELIGGVVAVSFDGKRAYVAYDTLDQMDPRDFTGWFNVMMTTEDCRLVCIDLETWETVAEITTAMSGGIAIKPDGSELFVSETYKSRVRVFDALTLEERWQVSTDPSFPVGIALLPDGSKAYAVCTTDTGYADILGNEAQATSPSPGTLFVAVLDTQAKEVVKRMPLESTCPREIAVQADGTKAYLSGGVISHAIVVDTVADEIVGDMGGEPVKTGGVAVRPFWWSTECLQVLGVATGEGSGTAGEDGTSTDEGGTAAGEDNDSTQASSDTANDGSGEDDGLSAGIMALIIILAAVAAGAGGATIVLLLKRRGPGN